MIRNKLAERQKGIMGEEKTAFEMMAEDLKTIREALQRLEKTGINSELMTLYIQKKTKLSQTIIKNVLYSQREFLREAFKTA